MKVTNNRSKVINKKILYMYREIMPYNIPVLKNLVEMGYRVSVIHSHKKRKSSYVPPSLEGVEFFDESDFDQRDLKAFAEKLNPDMAFVCDWSVRKFNLCGMYLRHKYNVPVVVGCDTQWLGGRQWANVFTSRFRQLVFFSHILVAGVRQYEYAKRIGFKNAQILLNLLSADVEKFSERKSERDDYSEARTFVFVGRFVHAKGVDLLLDAWRAISDRKGCKLVMIGEGPLKDELDYPDDVEIHPFSTQKELLEHAAGLACFVLPSIFEPWAVVIHEFAAAGMPLIVTDACGAAPHFVINNYNGYIVKTGSSTDLGAAMEKLINLDGETFRLFEQRSRKMSKTIHPELVARSLTSVLEQ